jgi:hypothetical protein
MPQPSLVKAGMPHTRSLPLDGATPCVPHVRCLRPSFLSYHAWSSADLREFYVGELHAEDRKLVPTASGDEKPSEDFMEQLRQFAAPWRYDTEKVEVHKSF